MILVVSLNSYNLPGTCCLYVNCSNEQHNMLTDKKDLEYFKVNYQNKCEITHSIKQLNLNNLNLDTNDLLGFMQ